MNSLYLMHCPLDLEVLERYGAETGEARGIALDKLGHGLVKRIRRIAHFMFGMDDGVTDSSRFHIILQLLEGALAIGIESQDSVVLGDIFVSQAAEFRWP